MGEVLRQSLFTAICDAPKMFIKGALSGLRQFLATESSFKNDEKCFLFHLRSSFRSQDI